MDGWRKGSKEVSRRREKEQEGKKDRKKIKIYRRLKKVMGGQKITK